MKRIFELRWRLPLFRRLAMWIAKHTPTCSEMARLSSHALERPLTLRQRFDRLAHFIACDWCLRYARHLRFLRKAAHSLADRETCLQTHTPPHALRPEARDRLKHRLSQEPPPTPSATL